MFSSCFVRSLTVLIAILGLAGAGCKSGSEASCGNGKLGVDEQCDCGTDPASLPFGCTDVNGAAGGECTTDCRAVPAEQCGTQIDEDGDGLIACDDPDCAEDPRCLPEDCFNGLDDNGDGDVDCNDDDCAGTQACDPEICDNNVDDNLDGRIDCQDIQCVQDPVCADTENCINGLDDDNDGLIDCADPDCTGETGCVPEDCSNGEDDNNNFRTDCADRGCIGDPACSGSACAADETVSLPALGATGSVSVDVSQAGNEYSELVCGISGGQEHVIAIEVGEQGQLLVHFDQTGDQRFGFYLQGGSGSDCIDAMNTCVIPSGSSGVIDLLVLPGGTYYFVVAEGSPGGAGTVDLVFTLADPINPTEICDNLIDDDGNGQTDCGDIACFELPGSCDQTNCQGGETPPVPDTLLGDLDRAGPAAVGFLPATQPEFLDTRLADVSYAIGCGGATGPDDLYHFNLLTESRLQLVYNQDTPGFGDHVFALLFAGDCQLAEHQCIDPSGAANGVINFPGDPATGGTYPPGEYYLLVKAKSAGTAEFQIYAQPISGLVEVCDDNGIDNDGDGDADCLDADCATHHVCVPENCANQVADVDQDGLAGCADTDPDDMCQCSFYCNPSTTCDYLSDPLDSEIIDLGLISHGSNVPFSTDTSVNLADYDIAACNMTPAGGDYVFYFTLTQNSRLQVDFTDPSLENSGALMSATRCQGCTANPDNIPLECRADGVAAGSWDFLSVFAGEYVLIVKPTDLFGTGNGGQFDASLRAFPP